MDFHFGPKLLVLGFVVALVTGMFSTAGAAVSIQPTPEIRLVGDQEPLGAPGHGMVSIGDTIVVSVQVSVGAGDSLLYVIADMRKYGGSASETLSTFQGQDATISSPAWVPECSDGVGTARMDSLAIWRTSRRNAKIEDATWKVLWAGGGNWWVVKTPGDTMATQAATGIRYYDIDTGDTLFSFVITAASGVCCTAAITCDHFEFETHPAEQASATYIDTLIVRDGGVYWIDDTPCPYVGHNDPTVQVIACADTCAVHGGVGCAQCDTMQSLAPGLLSDDGGGVALDYDTHMTTYAQLDDPAGLGAEFIESNDYTFTFVTDSAGVYYDFRLPDNLLNPASPSIPGQHPDSVCAYIDMRKLAHENDNDDIIEIQFDAHLLGTAYSDTNNPFVIIPGGTVVHDGWYSLSNPKYVWHVGTAITCIPAFNGWTNTEVLRICLPILPGKADTPADSSLMMRWISDSGDTTYFPIPTHKLLAVDNTIPAPIDTTASPTPPDTVTAKDITAVADMSIAGDADVLNPASYGFPNPDWVQVKIDLAGLFDLNDVVNGGQVWADMRGIGVYQYTGANPVPFGQGYLRQMQPLNSNWDTDHIGVIASPPSPYPLDSDSIITGVWIFDAGGNAYYIRSDSLGFPIDNTLPIVACSPKAPPFIYAEIAVDASPYPQGHQEPVASIGKPLNEVCGGLYNDRDEITLHANLGLALGPTEVKDVQFVSDANDPFCVGGIRLYDDGTHGSDPVNGDKNFTGHARIEVGGTMRHDTTFCKLDTGLDSLGFAVLVTDDAGNVARDSSCAGIRVDNVPPTITAANVSIKFWDDPATFGIDGDENGNGIVDKGDHLLFEWRAQDEPWGDGEIDSVWVNEASIDSSWSGHITLRYIPSGGIYRNCDPIIPMCHGFEVPYGTVEGDTLKAAFRVVDDAGNATGWCTFKSNLILDDKRPTIECDSIKVAISGPDTVASVGDTVSFSYAGPDTDVASIKIKVDDFRYEPPTSIELIKSAGVWTGSFVVMKGHETSTDYHFDVEVSDSVGNHQHCETRGIAVDNEPPEMNCHDVWVRLWDVVNNVNFRVVNAGDNLTAIYYDDDGDVVRVTADFSNYFSVPTVFDMVPTIHDGPAVMWGYRLDPVPDGHIDQAAGGLGTKVLITAYDKAGNSSSDWFCPMWHEFEGGGGDLVSKASPAGGDTLFTDYYLATHGGLCGDCLPVDTERPAPVPPNAITFQLLENSNGIANVGDRLRIIVNMGDPTAAGYDMQWASSAVQCDISQYGKAYSCHDWDDADMSDCRYLFLTDDAYSAGGEGDGKFSYFFWYQADSGYELVEGAPILPGHFNAAAGDTLTRIRVRSMDDAGNFSAGWTYSDVLTDAVTHDPVPVDNEIPEVEPSGVHVTYVDADSNGICDIGDTVTVTVDMTNAEGGPIAGVYAHLYDWGYPSQDMVPLTPGSPIYTITFPVGRNPGDFCWNQPDGDVGFEDQAADHCHRETLDRVTLRSDGVPEPEIQVLAQDVSGNWSHYKDTDPPYNEALAAAKLTVPPPPQYYIMIDSWPFTWSWPRGIDITNILADTDDPDPVNPTFAYNGSNVRALAQLGGRIGLWMYYQTDPRNKDVQKFYVYGDITGTPGTIDWTHYLGQPIVAGVVATDSLHMGNPPDWVSDVLPERTTPYHFAVLAVDDANNTSDPALTWITGTSADTTAPTGYVQAFFGLQQTPCVKAGQATSIGNDAVYVLGYLDQSSQYIQTAYAELWARIKDLDPSTEGDQPGEWHVINSVGQWPPSYPLPTAPFQFNIDGIHNEHWFGDLTKCTTFEFALVPWDLAGNHKTPDLAQKFVFTYDPFPPLMTLFAINGNPSPEGMDLSGSALVEVTAKDECPPNDTLTYWLYLGGMGDTTFSYEWPLLSRVTLPAGEAFSYTWDLVNYPAGQAMLGLWICDQSGNSAYHLVNVHVIDQSAPGGVFASVRPAPGMYSHPYYTRLIDGMSIPGKKDLQTAFWVQWPGDVPWSKFYDVSQVKLEYRIRGSSDAWTTLGVQTAYSDTVTWEKDLYFGYRFNWDSTVLQNGDQIDMRATVMDKAGNEQVVTVWLKVAAEAPILTLSIPDAKDVCGETRVKGDINIVGTETSGHTIGTYFVSYMYKKSSFPDLGDCNPFDNQGWVVWPDTMMIEGHPTSETIWRAALPTSKLDDGSYDIALITVDVAGNWSWDKNGDWCVDAGYFAWAKANGMGMTVVVQNKAPEIRIRKVNDFEAVDEGVLWPQPVYVQVGTPLTVTSWTASTCDIAQVDYYLDGDFVIDSHRGPVHVATSTNAANGYQVTFPATGGLEQYLEPNAFQNGYAKVTLMAVVTDLLGNVTVNNEYAEVQVWVLKTTPTSAFVTHPSPGEYVRSWVYIQGDVVDNEAVYDITYQYRPVTGGDWITIAQTKPHCGDPWNIDVNGNAIKWNTDLLADGDYQLRAVSRDANLTVDPNPSVVTVHVDNTAPVVSAFNLSPTYEVGEALPTAPSTYIGGPHVELSATGSDAGGIDHVHFMYKTVDADIDSATELARDDEAPYAYDWITGFPQIKSGWYDFIVKIEDKAGNETYSTKRVYVDQWAPDGWISHIVWSKGDDITPDSSNFYGVLAINGTCKDDVPKSQSMNGNNQKFDSGLKAAQFQYQPVTQEGYLGVATSETTLGQGPKKYGWVDLGEPVVGAGPDYTINWDTGTLVPGKYYLRIVGIDNVGNRADVDSLPILPYITINIVDMIAPKAIIAGVDNVNGYIWATTDTHGQNDIAFVRFEYKPATAQVAEWTVIGEVDTSMAHCLYGIPWHFEPLTGNFWVRAVAYDDNYDVVNFPDLYDQNPAMMFVTIANHTVTMQSTSSITSLTRWGNLDDYDKVGVKAVCAAGKPTVIVVYDNDPEDHFNVTWAKQLALERPDNPAEWVDAFSVGGLGDWGVATIIATYNNSGTVGALTSTVKVFRVTDAEGTKGVVSQDKMSVNIPAGAIYRGSEGLVVINVPRPVADPTLEEIIPVSDAVMMNFIGYHRGESYGYDYRYFDNGMRADVTLEYNQSEITTAMVEANLRVAWWDEDNRDWAFDGITNVSVNTATNVVTFKTTHTGAFAVVSATTFRITQPVSYPGCTVGGVIYTSRYPSFCSTIQDVINGIDEPAIKVTIDGPAGNKVLDNVTIYYGGDTPWPGVHGGYDEVSHMLCLALVAYSGDEDHHWTWPGGGPWMGLPAGTYTIRIDAMNKIGDKKFVTGTFTVDTAVPTIDFAGTYVAENPSFTLTVGDALSGIDPANICLDVYAVRIRGDGTEYREYLGTATPSAMTYDPATGTVTFNQMTFDKTLGDSTSIDVIVYDCRLGTPGVYTADDGITDCVGNHANPVWRRFTVDATPPVLTLLSGENDMDVVVKVEDATSGICNSEGHHAFDITINGEAFNDYQYVPTSNNHVGTLKFTVGADAATISITARDCVGNFSVLEIKKGSEVVNVTDVMSYPNPFSPNNGEYATISFDLTKRADVLIKIFDFAGENVATVADAWYDTGSHTVRWYGTDGNGKTVAAGAYIGYIKIDDGSKVIAKNLKIGVVTESK